MAQALYRKYRPMTFNDVIGQETVTKILRNQARDRKFCHAYIFTGTRGTGKTTCARIFARAINCQNPTADGEPCNKCDVCKGFVSGSVPDLYEIDAASNNSVADIRQMREEVVYTPVLANYKIYIIDEVHMLSSAAFNALLKTLEEPPAHAIFILATTEIHKVPATVLSRCQRYDFKRIKTTKIKRLLDEILKLENKSLQDEFIEAVAEMGDGSMRDSLSILEKILELDKPEDIESVLGIVGKQKIYELLQAAVDGDTQSLFTSIDELYSSSKDLSFLCNELMSELRAILVIKNVKDYMSILDKTESSYKSLVTLAKSYSSERIIYSIGVIQKTLQNLSISNNKRADVEICFLKISNPKFSDDISAVLARIADIEMKLDCAILSSVVSKEVIEKKEDSEKKEKVKSNAKVIPNSGKKQTDKDPISPEQVEIVKPTAEKSENINENKYHEFLLWDDICDFVGGSNKTLSVIMRKYLFPVAREKEVLILCQSKSDIEEINTNMDLIKAAFAELKKTNCTIKAIIGTKAEYINTEDLYENIEENEHFKFE